MSVTRILCDVCCIPVAYCTCRPPYIYAPNTTLREVTWGTTLSREEFPARDALPHHDPEEDA